MQEVYYVKQILFSFLLYNSSMKNNNKGLEKLGESFMTLANLILVLFLFNTYIQKDNYNIGVVLMDIYMEY